ncbi:hypothetical protein Pmani_008359 [Petrolisthes manimaculis]|uniref:Uncharacterized protein n=1 Tax=Petrolisthes manimaculis TaxID=1843537 RepID=A0AAE1Q6G1_9EUCA|nr:hypothetical protein Pmani_008359 [Petrolisthes manimaculis]
MTQGILCKDNVGINDTSHILSPSLVSVSPGLPVILPGLSVSSPDLIISSNINTHTYNRHTPIQQEEEDGENSMGGSGWRSVVTIIIQDPRVILGDEMGPCKCCRVCKKAEDEMCGGPFGVSGSCGNGLECVKEEYIDYDQAFGVCKRWLKSSVGSPGSSVYLDKPHHHRLTRTPTD